MCGKEKDPPAKTVEQGAPQFYGGIYEGGNRDDDISRLADYAKSTSWQPGEIVSASRTREAPPTYQSGDSWDRRILDTIVNARDILATYNLSFNDLTDTETHLVVDDCHRYNRKQKTAIQILSWVLTLPPRSVNALTFIRFMNHNPDREQLTTKEFEAAAFFDRLWEMSSANLVSQALEGDDVPELIRSKKMAYDMGPFPQEVQKVMDDDTILPGQRHSRILGLIRDAKYNFFSPIDISGMPLENFLSHFVDAINESGKQPKVLSSLSHTLIRLIQSIRKDIEEREIDKTGAISKKKMIVITAGNIDEDGAKHITKELCTISGGAASFSLQVVHLLENDKSTAAMLQQGLDDHRKGTSDIYDYTPLVIDEFFKKFITPRALAKIFFSENKNLDGLVKSKKITFHGKDGYLNGCEVIMLPEVSRVEAALAGVVEGNASTRLDTGYSASADKSLANLPVTTTAQD